MESDLIKENERLKKKIAEYEDFIRKIENMKIEFCEYCEREDECECECYILLQAKAIQADIKALNDEAWHILARNLD